MKSILFLIAVLISNCLASVTYAYEYNLAGVTFSHNDLPINKKAGRETPLSVVFQSGTEPFFVSIHFKEIIKEGSIDDFIKKEIKQHKQGGYKNEITISKAHLKGTDAYEIIRHSKIIKIRWFIFESLRNKKLYSFWLAENNMLKEENSLAIEGYEVMKATLQLSE